MTRWCLLTGLTAALAVAAPANSATEPRLPVCAPGPASSRPPTGPPTLNSPRACRSSAPLLESGGTPKLPANAFTPSGYHHLGAGTSGEWGGVSGRFSVVDGSIRPQTYDFVVGRFMAKRHLGGGRIAWLEAGWSETGWASPGRQHIYTFNTNTNRWQFYDQYPVRPGDQVWLDINGDPAGVWRAWLWWNNRWNLLTQQQLPLGDRAHIEQYVEVHVDASRQTKIDVPKVTVDNVRLRPSGGGPSRFWREDVPTETAAAARGGFCLDWKTRYDTWTAGDCPD
ncbi:hypothetical protein QLQ12_18865 [Actinoplanes sp. NEAU-A12]|uniref:Uncharacterized protein n=1 Tax=Actinoplanes sandaracinus TaxID=3045177 RepID=A0ABT6WLS1_9ACTN|nr:hypothetical protein [Actinoplanes sandaracinus]MDI6100674.1 hypothetical protein [Actinoplanes sandaracinus]